MDCTERIMVSWIICVLAALCTISGWYFNMLL
uniref:Uncharacterized protein n=1 Tax=Anguilla anguilla TaxID=7936 RepID=A0A0E9TJJ5_ANGAN